MMDQRRLAAAHHREDGLTMRQQLSANELVLEWQVRNGGDISEIKHKVLDRVEQILDNDHAHEYMWLKAADQVIKMVGQNMVSKRLKESDEGVAGPQMILVLPANGSEVET